MFFRNWNFDFAVLSYEFYAVNRKITHTFVFYFLTKNDTIVKRRIFIKTTVPAALGLSVFGLSACQGKKKESSQEKKMETLEIVAPFFKLSLAQFSIHKMIWEQKKSPYDFAALAKGWGFEGLEYVSGLYRKSLDHILSASEVANMVQESNRLAQEHGMKNLLIMVDMEGDLASEEKAKRDEGIDKHKKWVDAAAEMGCHSIRLNLFGSEDPNKWRDYSSESLVSLSDYAQGSGINILVENHGGFSSNGKLLMEVMNQVNKSNCGTLPDFGNFCLKRENNERWQAPCVEEYDKYLGTQELLPKAFAVSAKSYDFDENGNETTIDYMRMIKIVKDAGYTGYIGVEYEGEKMSEEEGILATKALLLKAAGEMS